MAGDPKYPGSQEIPDVPYAAYAQLLGLKGIVCDDPARVGSAWDEALACDRPVVLEFKVDNEIAPIPPHIMKAQGKKAAMAALHDPEKAGITAKGVRQKLTEYAEHLPGRGEK
jgi:pyruvate dehydrogenase (quinone)